MACRPLLWRVPVGLSTARVCAQGLRMLTRFGAKLYVPTGTLVGIGHGKTEADPGPAW